MNEKIMNNKIKNEILGLIKLILSLVLTLYFAFTSVVGFKYIYGAHTKDVLHQSGLFHLILSIILLSISLITFIMIILKKRRSVILLLFTVFLSTCCFIYETQYSKTSYVTRPIIISGKEAYQGIGYRYSFINWIWYEKDVVRSEDFTEDKVFHHFFGRSPKGYVSSSSLIYLTDYRDTGE